MTEPRDDGSSAPGFRERLRAPWWLWGIATVLVGTLGVAVGHSLGIATGLATAAVGETVVGWVLVSAAALVEVRPDVVIAGRASLPYAVMGNVRPLDAAAAASLRGRDADPRAYLLLRPWLPRAVRIDLADPLDPAPYWYVSTRRPAEFAAAVERARADAAGRDDGGAADEAG